MVMEKYYDLSMEKIRWEEAGIILKIECLLFSVCTKILLLIAQRLKCKAESQL